jgi:primosomal protein N' (replication factor Y)
MQFAEIILPFAGPSFYTYSVPAELEGCVVAGSVVAVPFGARKIVAGVVRRWLDEGETPVYKNIKPVSELLFPEPLVSAEQLALWEWMAEYYMCPLGEVMAAGLPSLLKKGNFTPYKRERKRVREDDPEPVALPKLSDAQNVALNGLRTAFRHRKVALLFGVPASGKSEVAFHAIASTLARGRDVLLLLPEISLTTQFVKRVRAAFGERVVLYHSGLTDRRRAEAYLRLAGADSPSLIVGTRQAVFLPARKLGLVVVDEEQDASYKQQDPAPRYNARDTAIVLAQLHGARVMLSSATPSLETWINCSGGGGAGGSGTGGGKYGFVELSERYGGGCAPDVIVSDTLRAIRRGERKMHFNKDLLDRIEATLAHGRQVLVFHNYRSFGTDKIAEELAGLFPEARIGRLDESVAGSETAFERILGAFERGETDILVGTGMAVKGLDFAGVSLVGILNADNLTNNPDFRASERAYQLIAQAAGRTGRHGGGGGNGRGETAGASRPDLSSLSGGGGGVRGEVVIQTVTPESRIARQAAAGDFRVMAGEMLAERAAYGYPPYSRLVQVMLRHAVHETLAAAAERFGELLRPDFGEQLLGPVQPVPERVKGEYALVFLLKVSRGGNPSRPAPSAALPMSEVRGMLKTAIRTLLAEAAFRAVSVEPNIDPQ